MNTQYFVWADGVEQGPMSLPQLMKEWRSGSLPKGFLWRRESDDTYQSPEALVEEEKPKAVTPLVEAKTLVEKIPRFWPSGFAELFLMVICVAGFVVSFVSLAIGAALMFISIAVILCGYAASILRALNEIVRKLHEMDRGRKGF